MKNVTIALEAKIGFMEGNMVRPCRKHLKSSCCQMIHSAYPKNTNYQELHISNISPIFI